MQLPPYGLLSNEYQVALSDKPMLDWQGSSAQYQRFIKEMRRDIATHIWPAYDYRRGKWKGAASEFAEAATKAELKICIDRFQRAGILERYPQACDSLPEPFRRNHLWHFRVEDGQEHQEPFLDALASKTSINNYLYYDPSYDPDVFVSVFLGQARRKIHGLFDFKPYFARPRPHQVASIYGLDKFQTRIAEIGRHTGLHPALISGHSVQGILLSSLVLETWLDAGEPSRESTEQLGWYAVDLGDRRVFAGVHYPTDNIASWILSLRLIPRAYRHTDKILSFALNAITQKSLVYQVITETFSGNKNLRHSLKLLEKQVAESRALLDNGLAAQG